MTPVRSNRCASRLCRHAGQLDDEADLEGTVMRATPTLTAGTVTAGPHA
jgi:hypothetical protein